MQGGGHLSPWGGGVCMTLRCVQTRLGLTPSQPRGHQESSHLPGLEAHLTSPLGAPALSEALGTSPLPSPVHGARWMVPCSTAASWSGVPTSCFSLELPPRSPSQVTLLWTLEEPGWMAGHPSRLSGVPSRRRPRTQALRRASGPGDHSLSARPAWQTRCVRAPSLRTPCSPPPPAAALGLPGGSPRGGGCAWLSPGTCRPVLPGATHARPQA